MTENEIVTVYDRDINAIKPLVLAIRFILYGQRWNPVYFKRREQ